MMFASGADFVFLFGKTNADISTDEPLHIVACVWSNKSVFEKADGYSQVGADNQLTLPVSPFMPLLISTLMTSAPDALISSMAVR